MGELKKNDAGGKFLIYPEIEKAEAVNLQFVEKADPKCSDEK